MMERKLREDRMSIRKMSKLGIALLVALTAPGVALAAAADPNQGCAEAEKIIAQTNDGKKTAQEYTDQVKKQDEQIKVYDEAAKKTDEESKKKEEEQKKRDEEKKKSEEETKKSEEEDKKKEEADKKHKDLEKAVTDLQTQVDSLKTTAAGGTMAGFTEDPAAAAAQAQLATLEPQLATKKTERDAAKKELDEQTKKADDQKKKADDQKKKLDEQQKKLDEQTKKYEEAKKKSDEEKKKAEEEKKTSKEKADARTKAAQQLLSTHHKIGKTAMRCKKYQLTGAGAALWQGWKSGTKTLTNALDRQMDLFTKAGTQTKDQVIKDAKDLALGGFEANSARAKTFEKNITDRITESTRASDEAMAQVAKREAETKAREEAAAKRDDQQRRITAAEAKVKAARENYEGCWCTASSPVGRARKKAWDDAETELAKIRAEGLT